MSENVIQDTYLDNLLIITVILYQQLYYIFIYVFFI